MFGTQHLLLFVVSGLLLNLTPGQDTLYIVGRSIAQGRRAGCLPPAHAKSNGPAPAGSRRRSADA